MSTIIATMLLCLGVMMDSTSCEIFLPPNSLLLRGKSNFSGGDTIMPRRQYQPRRSTIAAAVFSPQKQNDIPYSSSSANSSNNGLNLWPPWPFNLLSQQQPTLDSSSSETTTNKAQERRRRIKNNAALIYSFVKHGLHVGMVQVRQVGSAVTVHLPPSAPPILLLALAPSSTPSTAQTAAAVEAVKKRAAPLFFTNPSVQKLTLTTVGLAILSWAHSEARKIHRLAPLPILDGTYNAQKSSLRKQRDDLRKAVLPPFLPEEITSPPPNPPAAAAAAAAAKGKKDEELEKNGTSFIDLFQEWRYERRLNKYEADVSRRKNVYNELTALRDLKLEREEEQKKASLLSSSTKSSRKFWKWGGGASQNNKKVSSSEAEPLLSTNIKEPPMGYALITGASRGIGRAIAIELARWNIPLILLARDTTQLSELASDIETCYNVPCHVLSADLSSNGVNEAKRIHQATTKAKLRVDILVNNAGICHHGDMVDMTPDEINSVMNVNAASVATLSQLYGSDMKKRKRGRIMMVSSIMGMLPSGPGVSLYAATKSFQRSLAISMGRELEKHGVGVTSVCPGAVQTSDFRAATKGAICWKLPFYVMKPETIAHRSVSAMLLGDTELLPGWHNRGFVKGVIPLLPQRLSTIAVEFFWSPWSVDFKLPFVWNNNEKDWRNKITFAKKNVEENDEEEMTKKNMEEDLVKYIYPMNEKTSCNTETTKKRPFWGSGSSSSSTLAGENLPPQILNLEAEENGGEITSEDNETSRKEKKQSSQSSLRIQPLTRDRNDPPHEKRNAPKETDGDGEQEVKDKETTSDTSSEEKSSKDIGEKVDTDALGIETENLKEIEDNHKAITTEKRPDVDDTKPEPPDNFGKAKENVAPDAESGSLDVETNALAPKTEKSSAKDSVNDESAERVDNTGGTAEEEKEEVSETILDEFETVVEKRDEDQSRVEIFEERPRAFTKNGENVEDTEKPLNNSSFLQLEFVE